MEVILVTKERNLSSPLRRSESVQWIQIPSIKIAQESKRIFVFSPATKLPEYSDFLHEAVKCKSLLALFIYEDIESNWLPQMLHRAQIRALKRIFVHKEFELPKRIISAWTFDMQKQTIADAKVFDDRILIVACDLQEYEVPFSSIPALKRLPAEEHKHYEIVSDGSYIHWPDSDIHLDLDAFRYATDDIYKEKVDRESLIRNKNYGEAIAKFRKSYGLRQSDIPGLSERQVRRVEHGGSITSNVVKSLASAHGLEANDYLDQLANMLH